MNKILIILIGNIGSGKSTLTKAFVDRGFIAIARDRLRYSIGGGQYIFNPIYEPIIHKANFNMFRSFVDLGSNIIIDEVNVSRRLRKKYIQYGQEHGYKIIGVELPRYSEKESVKRRIASNHGTTDSKTWKRVWQGFNLIYQEPSRREGFNRVIKIMEDISQNSIGYHIEMMVNNVE